MDPTHNPEFTSCEVYMANTTLEYMMELTEQLFRELVHIVHSTTCITVQDTCIDFSQPFHRIDVYEGLIQCGIHLPEDLHTPEALQSMLHICHEHGIQEPNPITNSRVLDKIIHEFIESKCVEPTFLLHHPVILSPLAKCDDARVGICVLV
uniref:Lysine--tRNA ligase n=1 Tax=Lygus hesperus TaxID=30085 RepID=A0A0A9YTQ7_LYGHE